MKTTRGSDNSARLGGERAEARREVIQVFCDLAEKRLADPQHPDVLKWQKMLAERRSADAA